MFLRLQPVAASVNRCACVPEHCWLFRQETIVFAAALRPDLAKRASRASQSPEAPVKAWPGVTLPGTHDGPDGGSGGDVDSTGLDRHILGMPGSAPHLHHRREPPGHASEKGEHRAAEAHTAIDQLQLRIAKLTTCWRRRSIPEVLHACTRANHSRSHNL
jgi:hypothetical protein